MKNTARFYPFAESALYRAHVVIKFALYGVGIDKIVYVVPERRKIVLYRGVSPCAAALCLEHDFAAVRVV